MTGNDETGNGQVVAADRHPSRWKPGQSGNPNKVYARKVPGIARKIRECLNDDPTPLIYGLIDIACNEKEKTSDRIAAYRELLDRGYGKAPAFAPIESKDDDPLERSDLDKAILEIVDELAARRIEGATVVRPAPPPELVEG
jgi:hypothetical protein